MHKNLGTYVRQLRAQLGLGIGELAHRIPGHRHAKTCRWLVLLERDGVLDHPPFVNALLEFLGADPARVAAALAADAADQREAFDEWAGEDEAPAMWPRLPGLIPVQVSFPDGIDTDAAREDYASRWACERGLALVLQFSRRRWARIDEQGVVVERGEATAEEADLRPVLKIGGKWVRRLFRGPAD